MKSLIKGRKLFDFGVKGRTTVSPDIFRTIARKIYYKKPITVGVDIGLECLRFIKMTRTSDNTPILLGYKCIPFPPQISKQTHEFETFLQTELTQFCGHKKKYDLWAIMPTAHVDVRHIRIPKDSKVPIEKAVFWAAKKESAFNEEESILDFEVEGELVEQNTKKLLVMVYTAPIKKVEEIKGLFYRIGTPLTGISTTPFGIENIFRSGWVSNIERTNAVLFIGNDFSRIDIYSQGNLVMTRDIKAGTKSNIESLIEAFNYKKHALSDMKKDEEAQMDDEQARKILFSLSQDSPSLTEKDLGFGLKKDEVFEMILPALKRLVRQLERTFEYYESIPGAEKIDKIYISGVMNIDRHIIEYISNELGIEGGVLDPLGTQAICSDITSISERIAFTPSLGIALSDNIRTPNLLCTYKDREKDTNISRVNMGVFGVFIIVTFICFCIFIYQRHSVVKKKIVLAGVERQLSEYKPRLNKEVILQMVDDVKEREKQLKVYSKRYLGLTVVNEISVITPPHISISKLNAFLGDYSSDDKKPVVLGVNGIVTGDRHTLETRLLDYVMKLRASQIFSQITIQESAFAFTDVGVILQFSITVTVAPV